MFRGRMTVDFRNGKDPTDLIGTFLYKPDNGMWYVGGCRKFPLGTSFDKCDVVSMVDYDEE